MSVILHDKDQKELNNFSCSRVISRFNCAGFSVAYSAFNRCLAFELISGMSINRWYGVFGSSYFFLTFN